MKTSLRTRFPSATHRLSKKIPIPDDIFVRFTLGIRSTTKKLSPTAKMNDVPCFPDENAKIWKSRPKFS